MLPAVIYVVAEANFALVLSVAVEEEGLVFLADGSVVDDICDECLSEACHPKEHAQSAVISALSTKRWAVVAKLMSLMDMAIGMPR